MMPTFTTPDSTQLHYLDWGVGPILAFSHGWATSSAIWEYQMTALTEAGFRCVALDRRGCGRSDDPGHGYDLDTFADDFAAFLDQVEADTAVIVAHSMGCAEVVRYLTRHGTDRVAKLVMVGTSTPLLAQTDDNDNPDGIPAAIFHQQVTEFLRDRPAWIRAAAPGFIGRHVDVRVSDEVYEWGIGITEAASPLAASEMLRLFPFTDSRAELAALTVPTLVIHGDSDAGNPVELCGRRTADLLPNAELKVYERAAHGLMLTHPAELNTDIVAFVKA
jgi:non-heme chloroperoxidase